MITETLRNEAYERGAKLYAEHGPEGIQNFIRNISSDIAPELLEIFAGVFPGREDEFKSAYGASLEGMRDAAQQSGDARTSEDLTKYLEVVN